MMTIEEWRIEFVKRAAAELNVAPDKVEYAAHAMGVFANLDREIAYLPVESAVHRFVKYARGDTHRDERRHDTWYAYECMPCGLRDAGTGVVFDVRRSGPLRQPLPRANCPVCGEVCAVRATWAADDGGYKPAYVGMRSDSTPETANLAPTAGKR